MRFALVDSIKSEPKKGLKGICFCCGSETIAKCGRYKVHHWAHKNKKHCDPWWENESEWHRHWKSYFPLDCQEITFADTNGERHIADVYSPKKVVIEFQSYAIDDTESRAREAFYGNMIWIVNGCKGPLDAVNFNLSVFGAHTLNPRLRKFRWVGRGKIFEKWSHATKPVYIDFGSGLVWQLLEYDIKSKHGLVLAIPKDEFIQELGGNCT
ncbi:hypothetical protein ABRI18_000341 [Vibrio fluvialis]